MKNRVERLIELLPDAGVDLLVVSDLLNLRYLTGYRGTNGVALIGPRARIFITDFRYIEQASEQVHPSFRRDRGSQDLLDSIKGALPQEPVRLGFEAAHVSVAQHQRLRELLAERVELVPVDGLIEGLRLVKEPQEVAAIQRATELADAAFRRVLEEGLVGRTERDVAFSLEAQMHQRGAQRPSFDTIVATGTHGALHATPRDVEIARGDLVVIDWGAELDGYCSDCTRTVAAGDAGSREREVYQLVLDAQRVGLEAVRAGVHGKEADAAARAVIEGAGQGDHFGHGLGHGVGLDVHEGPRLSQRSEDHLKAGNTVTVEPGVYLPGELGVRIEDLVVVTDGGSDILTAIGKELIVID